MTMISKKAVAGRTEGAGCKRRKAFLCMITEGKMGDDFYR